mgnify:CR=1 FL=1|jgi:hypothetical protein
MRHNILGLKLIFLFLVFVGLNSCKVKPKVVKTPNERQMQYYESCVMEFKIKAFKSCLKTGFHSSEEINLILDSDASGRSDFRLGFDNYRHADSIGKSVLPNILADSIKLNYHYILGLDSIDAVRIFPGKYVLKNCLELVMSTKLDSIARSKVYDICK